MEAYPFRQAQGEVRVALVPFFTAERTRGTFTGGEDFPERGLLPVQVIIENGSAGGIQVHPQDFLLIRPNGERRTALSADDAFSMVKLPVGWWALGAGFVGGSVPGYRNEARLRDLESRGLRETAIAAGESGGGFVYFAIPEDESNLQGSRVVFPLKAAVGWDLLFEIPIAGRRDIPTPPSRAETPEPPAPAGPTMQGGTRTEGAGGQGVIIRSPAR
jgi:hypothetical protein